MRVTAKAVWVFVSVSLLGVGLARSATPGAPASKAPAAKPVAKPKPPPKIDGVVIARPSGFVSLKLNDNHFVLAFYDAERRPVEPDVPRASLRWNVRYQPNPERTVLNHDGGGNVLTSVKFVRPPHSFKVFLSLLPADEAAAVESYAVDFNG